MKRTLFVLIAIILAGILSANPMNDIDNWASGQTHPFAADDVVTFMNGRAEGDIAFGSEYVFNSAGTYSGTATTLDATHFVVAYYDGGNSSYGTAIVGTVSGNTISYGAEYVFNAAITYELSATTLDATHFVVTYRDNGNFDYGTAIVGTVSGGNTISYGAEYVFNSGTTYGTSSVTLDAAHFVVTYRDAGNSYYGTAIVGTVSGGDIISYGAEYVFNNANTYYNSAATLDAAHFVVAYADGGNSFYSTAIVGTVSGSTITYGAEYVFNDAYSNGYSPTTLDATHFVVVYADNGNGDYGTAVVGTVSGGDIISYGAEYVFKSSSTSAVSATTLDNTRFVVAYYRFSCYAKVGTVSGNTITYGTEFLFNSGTTNVCSATTLDADLFVISYRDDSHSSYGTAIVGEIEGEPPTPVVLSTFNAAYENGSSLLSWTTQSESNNLGWNIYRSETELAEAVQVNNALIQGAGSTSQPTNYEFSDEQELTAETSYYYWLESVNFSNETETYGPISLTIPAEEEITLPEQSTLAGNYPNPVHTQTNPVTSIRFSVKENDTAALTIFNARGQFIDSFEYVSGEYTHPLNVSKYQTGIYFYKLETDNYSETRKMLILR